jgi:hypothetical protein
MMVFGGYDGSEIGEMWEYRAHLNEWRMVHEDQGPLSGTMAFDPMRSQTVLLGTRKNDTWTWDGSLWTRRTVNGPPTRDECSVAFDGRRIIAFGGRSSGSTPFSDTWGWDGTAWAQLAATGPSARFGAAVTYDSGHHRVVLLGGFVTGPGSPTDTWEWDGDTWRQASVSGPISSSRSYAIAYDEARGHTVAAVTPSTGPLATWVWDGQDWTQRFPEGSPSHREGYAMAFDPRLGGVVLFGGSDLSDCWLWDGQRWTALALGPIPGRTSATMTYDSSAGQLLVFGGRGPNPPSWFSILDDTWSLGCACYGNCDRSTTAPILDVNDFACFMSRFVGGHPYANCDGSVASPVLNSLDFMCFLNRFAAGCS